MSDEVSREDKVRPESIENLKDIDRVLRQQGFSDIANLLQEQAAKQEKAKYAATIAKLEETIRVGAEKGEQLREHAKKQAQEILELSSEVASLKAKLTDRVWVRFDDTGRAIAAYASESVANYYAGRHGDEFVETRTVPALCKLFSVESGLRYVAENKVERLTSHEIEQTQEILQLREQVQALQAAQEAAQRHIEFYRKQGILGRIFRRKPLVGGISLCQNL